MSTPETFLSLLADAGLAPPSQPKKKELYELVNTKYGENNVRFQKTGRPAKQAMANDFVATSGIHKDEFIDFVKDLTLPELDDRHREMDFAIPQDSHQKNNFILKKENPKDFEIILVAKEIGKPWLKAVLRRGDDIILRSSTFDSKNLPQGKNGVSKNIKKSHNDGNFVFKTVFLVDISFWAKLKQCY